MALLHRGARCIAGRAANGVTFGDMAPSARLFFAGPATSAKGGSREGDMEMLMEALKPKTAPPPPKHTLEDAERAKQYSRLKMAEHRKLQGDLSRKLKLMRAAVMALPEELREAAVKPDLSLMPAKRPMPLASPNIEGYYEGKQREAEQAAGLGGSKRR